MIDCRSGYRGAFQQRAREREREREREILQVSIDLAGEPDCDCLLESVDLTGEPDFCSRVTIGKLPACFLSALSQQLASG